MAIDGTYKVTTRSMMGVADGELTLATDGDVLTGMVNAMGIEVEISNGKVIDENTVTGEITGDSPMGQMTMQMEAKIDGNKIEGTLKAKMGGAMFSGERV